MNEKLVDEKTKMEAIDIPVLSEMVSEYVGNDACNVIVFTSQKLINLAAKDEELKDILDETDLVLPGEKGKLDELIDEQELMELVHSLEGLHIMFISKNDKYTSKLEKKFTEEFPKLKYCGNYVFREGASEDQVINHINTVAPEVLCIMLDSPFQEKWVHEHKSKMNVKLCVVVGGCLDDVFLKKLSGGRWISKFITKKLHSKLFQN